MAVTQLNGAAVTSGSRSPVSGVEPCPAGRPLRKDAQRNRERIIEAADLVFAERGLDATLDDVAERAGVGVGTVYRRFADKGELLDALFVRHFEALLDVAERAVLLPRPWDGVVFLLEESLAIQAANRGLRQLLMNGNVGSDPVKRARDRLLPAIAAVFQRAQAAGVMREDIQTSDMPFMCMMVGSVVDHSYDVDPELWRRYLAVLLDGLRVRRTKPRQLPVEALSPRALETMLVSRPIGRRRPLNCGEQAGC